MNNHIEFDGLESADEYADGLEYLIQTLQAAKQLNFAISSNLPIELLFSIITDSSIALSSLLKEGKQSQKTNVHLRWTDGRDDLGNQKSIKFFDKRYLFWDPRLSRFYKEIGMISQLVSKRKKFDKNFMSLLNVLYEISPQVFEDFTSDLRKQKNRHRNNGFYYRRLRKKR